MLDRDHAGALHENRRARGVVFDQLAQIGHQRRRRDDPPQAESRHQPCLGKTVGADQAVVRVGDVEKRRRARACLATGVVQALVDIVGDDPDAVFAAMLEGGSLFSGAQGPAGRIVGRVDHDRACAGCERIEQSIDIERPTAAAEPQRNPRHVRAENLWNLSQIRP